MKAMKGLSMKSVLGSVRGRSGGSNGGAHNGAAGSSTDTPEEAAARSVRLFCESGGPGNSGEEVLHLPTIVEAAESSPAAAKECAKVIRKFLGRDNFSRPHVQYNAIMLIRILSDNPGKTFTRNIDKKFVESVKELLRAGRDPSVKQILMETLDTFERERKQDEGLSLLIQMWEKEKGKMPTMAGLGVPPIAPGPPPNLDPHNQNYFSRSHNTSRGLPAPHELATRIEEAKNSAKLLTQLSQSTPPNEFQENELLIEFANRCTSASRSIQGYIAAQNPAPDNETMLTLIETNEQLALALSKHQRGVLQARRSLGLGVPAENGTGTSSRNSPNPDPIASVGPPPGPPPSHTRPVAPVVKPPSPPAQRPTGAPRQHSPRALFDSAAQSLGVNTKRTSAVPAAADDPFKDPAPVAAPYPTDTRPPPSNQFEDGHGLEPYHPGFKPTMSYVGRQESAAGHLTMHAAVIPETPAAELDASERRGATPPRHKEDEGDGDAYDVSPVQAKTPIYRY